MNEISFKMYKIEKNKLNQIYGFLPTLRLFQFIGISPFSISSGENKPVASRNFKIYSSLQILVFLLALLSGLYDRDLYLSDQKNNVGNTVDFVQLIGIRMAHLVILFESLFQYKNLMRFYGNLVEIDSLMVKRLNIRLKFDQEIHRNLVTLCLMVSFYFGMEFLVLVALLMRGQYYMVAYWTSYLIPYLVSCFRYYQTISCVVFVKTRFQLLNEKLEYIKVKKKRQANVQFKVSSKLIATIGLREESYFKLQSSTQ